METSSEEREKSLKRKLQQLSEIHPNSTGTPQVSDIQHVPPQQVASAQSQPSGHNNKQTPSRIKKVRIYNPYQPRDEQHFRERKIKNDSDVRPLPVYSPLKGTHLVTRLEDLKEFNIAESYPFHFVSSETDQTSYQLENDTYDVVSNKVKWSYLQMSIASNPPLRRDRNKISVSLTRDKKSIGNLNLDEISGNSKVLNILNSNQSESTLFGCVSIDPIQIDDMVFSKQFIKRGLSLVTLNEKGLPHSLIDEKTTLNWYDLLGCTEFNGVQKDEIYVSVCELLNKASDFDDVMN